MVFRQLHIPKCKDKIIFIFHFPNLQHELPFSYLCLLFSKLAERDMGIKLFNVAT